MSYQKFQVYFFLAILTLSGVLTLVVFSPYLTMLAFGGVLAVVYRPIYRYCLKWIRSETAAAFLTLLCVVLTILLPTMYFFAALSTELAGLVVNVKNLFTDNVLADLLARVLPPSFTAQIPAFADELIGALRTLVGVLTENLVAILKNVVGVFFSFLIILISVYYLLKDGSKIKKEFMALSPLGDEYDELVLQRVIVAIGAVMGGMVIVGLIKGLVSGIFFYLFGVPAPLFWGSMTGLASFVPVLGSALVTIPVVIYLLLTGHIGAGIALGIISFAIIGAIDNIIQPKLVQSQTNIHPLLVLLSILGGLSFYGFSGFILGPLTLAVTMALLDIYKKEFRNYLERAI